MFLFPYPMASNFFVLHVLKPHVQWKIAFFFVRIKRFTITDKDVGKVIAVEAYLRLVGSYKYTWQLLKVGVSGSQQ